MTEQAVTGPAVTGPAAADTTRPRLSRGSRLIFDDVRGTHVLLYPEGVLFPSGTAVDVLARCDGTNTVGGIVEDLTRRYRGVESGDVEELVGRLAERGLLELGEY